VAGHAATCPNCRHTLEVDPTRAGAMTCPHCHVSLTVAGGRQRRAARKRPTALIAVAASVALLLVAIILVWGIRRGGSRPTGQQAAPPPVDQVREHNAEVIFRTAQRAANQGKWLTVSRELDRLTKDYGTTQFHATNHAAVDQLRQQAAARLQPKVSRPKPKTTAPAAGPAPRFFHGGLRRLPDGRVELTYDWSDGEQLKDWQPREDTKPSMVDGELRMGARQGTLLTHRAALIGDVELGGTWCMREKLGMARSCVVGVCRGEAGGYGFMLITVNPRIWKGRGDKPIAWGQGRYDEGQPHTFRLVRASPSVEGWIDGAVRVRAQDADYDRGAVFLSSWEAHVGYDDIRIIGRLDPKWLAQHPDAAKQIAAAPRADRWTTWTDLLDGKSLVGWRRATGGKFARSGSVLVENGAVVLGAGKPWTAVVSTQELPTLDYELELEARRVKGSEDFCDILFPVGSGYGRLLAGGDGGGRLAVSVKAPVAAEEGTVRAWHRFASNRWYRLRLRVSRARVEVQVDDQRLLSAPTASIGVELAKNGYEGLVPLGIFTWNTGSQVRNIRLRRLGPAPKLAEWQSLFDGESLDGWRVATQHWFADHGKVTVTDGRVVLGRGPMNTGVVWTGQFPETDYEVMLEVMRLEGDSVFADLLFPVAGSHCVLVVHSKLVSLDRLDGRSGNDHPAAQEFLFEPKRWYRLRLRVTRERVQAWVEDQRLIDLPTAEHRWSIRPDFAALRPFAIFNYQGASALRNIRVRRLPPEGVPAVDLGGLATKPFEPFDTDFERADFLPWRVYGPARFHIGSGVLDAKAPTGKQAWMVLEDREFDDFILEANVKDAGGPSGLWYGLFFRMRGLRGLFFTLSRQRRCARLMAIAEHQPHLKDGAPGVALRRREVRFAPELGRAYHLRVECVGTSVRCFLDDKLVCEATDETFLKGRVAVFVNSANVQFDNFRVAPAPTRPTEPAQALGRLWLRRAEGLDASAKENDVAKFRAWSDFLERFPKASPEVLAKARRRWTALRDKVGNSMGLVTERSRRYQAKVFHSLVRELPDGRMRVVYECRAGTDIRDWSTDFGFAHVNQSKHFCMCEAHHPLSAMSWLYRHGDDVRVELHSLGEDTFGFTLFGMAGEPRGRGVVLTVGEGHQQITTLGVAGKAPWFREPQGATGKWEKFEIGILKGQLVYRRNGKERFRRRVDVRPLRGRQLILWFTPRPTRDQGRHFRTRYVDIRTRPQDDWLESLRPGGPPPRTHDHPDADGWLGMAHPNLGGRTMPFRWTAALGWSDMAVLGNQRARSDSGARKARVQDCVISAKVEMIEEAPETFESAVAVYFRFSPAKGGYDLVIHRRGGAFLRHYDSSFDKGRAARVASSPRPRETRGILHLTIVARGPRVEAYCNGQLILSHQAADAHPGVLGIGVDHSAMVVHDFKYRLLPSDPLYQKVYGGKAP